MASFLPPTPCAILKLWVDYDSSSSASSFSLRSLRELYREHVNQHNAGILSDPYPNAGFDVFVPYTLELPSDSGEKSTMIKLGIHCEMYTRHTAEQKQTTGYFLMARSSLAKTPLMQSNHIGLIDSGYRGEIMAPVRNLGKTPYTVVEGTRLFQLCHPSALPMYVELVNDVSELSSTRRDVGGFGSTGQAGALRG